MNLDHPDASLPDLLKKLQIPADYARIDHIDSTTQLDHWKQSVHSALDQIIGLVKCDEELSLEDQGHIVFASSPFAISFPVQSDQISVEHEQNVLDNWTTPDARQAAQGTLISVFIYTVNEVNPLVYRATCSTSVLIPVSSTSRTGPHLQLEADL